jgi:ATP-dependent DNA helicase
VQAQDRCHRIGQTKNVAVYRLLTKGSVEIEMMETQISKKKLERLSIVGGDYRKAGKRSRGEMTTDELRRLLQDDVHNLQRMSTLEVSETDIPEDELERIMDRERVFAPDLPEEGKMYDVVTQTSESLLSGMT